jgi:hypothetical protein
MSSAIAPEIQKLDVQKLDIQKLDLESTLDYNPGG